jgi:hypothetical protein
MSIFYPLEQFSFPKLKKLIIKMKIKIPQVPHKFEIKINLNKNPWYHNSYGK